MKILIIKLGALGDIIMSTPIIKKLQEHYSDSEICLLTSTAYKELFINWENIFIKTTNRGGIIDTISIIRWIRENEFSHLYDLQSNDRTTIISALSGIPLRAGNHPRFPYHINPGSLYKGQCHAFDRLNEILKNSEIEPAKPKPYLPADSNIEKKISGWINSKQLTDKKFVIIHAGSSRNHKQKRWTRFSELAKSLYDKNIDIVWIGSNDDNNVNKKLSKSFGINATNEFTVLELIELGKYAIFAVTNDSAPMHILSCANIPIYGLFGPTNPRRTHALGQKNRVINASSYFPLSDDKFNPGKISQITLSHVLEKIKRDNLIS